MGKEIERKFLVKSILWENLEKPAGKLYRQGYILTDPDKTIRVRVVEDKGFITIKGRSVGMSRAEFEYEIPVEDAHELLSEFTETEIAKTRYVISFEGKDWEVDVFEGENAGLVVAEIELESESEVFILPDWVNEEVTHEKKYFNSQLVKFPFKNWD